MMEKKYLLKSKSLKELIEFYVIEEEDTKEQFTVPCNKIDPFQQVVLNEYYRFTREVNKNRNYFHIIPNQFKIGQEIIFNIDKLITINEKNYFLLNHSLNYDLIVKAFEWQKGFKKIKCRITRFDKSIPILKNIDETNFKWEMNKPYTFPIKGFSTFQDPKGKTTNCLEIIVESNIIKVKTTNWQNEINWKHKEIQCKIVGITYEGLPKLITYDKRHHKFAIGQTYKFYIIEFTEKTLKSGTNKEIIKIRDETNEIYEVNAIPNQVKRLKENDLIECEVYDINTKIFLKQKNVEDPFFYRFEEIIENKRLKEKFFNPFLNDNNQNNSKLNDQYKLKNGFWVFTYCNHILLKLKFIAENRADLEEVIEIIELHVKIEEWILKKGILRAIFDQNERKSIKQKILKIIENTKIEKESIEIITKNKEKEFFKEQKEKLDFKKMQLKSKTDEKELEVIRNKIQDIEEKSKNIKGIDKIIIHSALKTICAFANTNGGHLLIGVSDDKKIFGLEQDYNSFNQNKDRDEFGKFFDSTLKEYFGDSFSSSLLEKEYIKFSDGDILVIKVNKSLDEVFLLRNEEGKIEENLYVRNLSSSVKLKGIELSKFLKTKFRQQLLDKTI